MLVCIHICRYTDTSLYLVFVTKFLMHAITRAALLETLSVLSQQILKMKDDTDTDTDSEHLTFSNLAPAN